MSNTRSSAIYKYRLNGYVQYRTKVASKRRRPIESFALNFKQLDVNFPVGSI